MEDKQLLELILNKLNGMEITLSTHTQQLEIIKEQTARNAELESKFNVMSKEMNNLKTDVSIIKKAITN